MEAGRGFLFPFCVLIIANYADKIKKIFAYVKKKQYLCSAKVCAIFTIWSFTIYYLVIPFSGKRHIHTIRESKPRIQTKNIN